MNPAIPLAAACITYITVLLRDVETSSARGCVAQRRLTLKAV